MWDPYANSDFGVSADAPLSKEDPGESSMQKVATYSDYSAGSGGGKASSSSSSPGVPMEKVGDDLCTICGDRASGYHYNALSCEGCKGFFRRSVMRNAFYECKYGGNCKMDMWMRRKCQACRMKQCRDVGMKEECLLSERQCVARNARRKKKMKGDSDVASMSCEVMQSPIVVEDCRPGSGPCQTDILDMLTEEQQELIKRIVIFQDKYELPSKDELSKISELKLSETMCSDALADAIFVHMVEMTILVTRLVVEFAKRLPGFRSICKDDQIILLKGSASEVMMLRTARRYDPETNTVVFGTGTPFSQNSMAFGGLQGYVDTMFEFSRGMSQLYVDNAEYALLTAICIFSDRPGLTNAKAVQKIQDVYTEVLLAYMKVKHPTTGSHVAKLLMKLVTLRSLSNEHSQVLYNLKLEKGPLPPLLSEYFDLTD